MSQNFVWGFPWFSLGRSDATKRRFLVVEFPSFSSTFLSFFYEWSADTEGHATCTLLEDGKNNYQSESLLRYIPNPTRPEELVWGRFVLQ